VCQLGRISFLNKTANFSMDHVVMFSCHLREVEHICLLILFIEIRNLRIVHRMVNRARIEASVLSRKQLLTNIFLICQMFILNIKVFIFNNIIICMQSIYCSRLSLSGARVTLSLVLCVCLIDRCLSFCPFSFCHCVAVLRYTDSHYPFGIFKLFF